MHSPPKSPLTSISHILRAPWIITCHTLFLITLSHIFITHFRLLHIVLLLILLIRISLRFLLFLYFINDNALLRLITNWLLLIDIIRFNWFLINGISLFNWIPFFILPNHMPLIYLFILNSTFFSFAFLGINIIPFNSNKLIL